MNPIKIMKVPIHPVTNEMMTGKLEEMVENPEFQSIMTPNPEMVMAARTNDELMNALSSADLVIPDGIGLIIASKIKNLGLIERVTGIDTMERVLKICSEQKRSIFVLGGKPGRGEKALEKIRRSHPGITQTGCYHGYFSEEQELTIIQMIQQEAPDVLFVCLGTPRQEIWINQYKDQLPCRLAMGAGGSVDVYAGAVKRAPHVFQKAGLEWLYRLCQEPSRLGRMTILPVFLWKAIWMKPDEELKEG